MTPGEVTRLYFALALSGLTLSVALLAVWALAPRLLPLAFAVLISATIVLAYVAWSRGRRT
jgi:hypothetical protein